MQEILTELYKREMSNFMGQFEWNQTIFSANSFTDLFHF